MSEERPRFDPLTAGEKRRRWTETDVGLTIWSKRYLDCDGCGRQAEVAAGQIRTGVVDRALECSCGRRWRQLIY